MRTKSQIPGASLFLLFIFALPLGAAIPRETEVRLQIASPEQLTVVITEAQKKAVKRRGSHRWDIVAKAKVVAVKKTKSELKKGDVVEIRYSMPNIEKSPEPGAWPSLITKGTRYKAFLKVKDAAKKHYEPAASSGSFEKAGEG